MQSHLSELGQILHDAGVPILGRAALQLSPEEVAYAEFLRDSRQQRVGVVEGQHADDAPAG